MIPEPEPAAGFERSGARLEDADDVAGLVRAYEIAHDGVAETTGDDIRDFWRDADLARDVVLVREGGRLVAAGLVERFSRGALIDGFVHPDATGRGLGTFLVRALEARGRELTAEPWIEAGVSLGDEAGQALFAAEGYRPVRRWLRMAAELDGEPTVPELPGVVLRDLRPGEETEFHAVYEASFADHWGHVDEPFERWWQGLEARSGGDLSLLFVAEREGRIVGVEACRRRFGMGWIGLVGVLPEARGLGIGRALVLHAFAAFWARNERQVGLGVDAQNETGATRLYESVGMRVLHGAVSYAKTLA